MSAAGDGLLLGRVAKVLGYIAASSKGGKKGERDSAYIRSILAGGNPAAGGDAQVGPCKPVECRVVSTVFEWRKVQQREQLGPSTDMWSAVRMGIHAWKGSADGSSSRSCRGFVQEIGRQAVAVD